MFRWVLWTTFVVAWTVVLEMPAPWRDRLPGGSLNLTYRLIAAKGLHVAAYGLFAVLSGWVAMPLHLRPLMMFFLMAHACATEVGQELLEPICHRGGSLSDVALDQLGIAGGMVASWKWWTRHERAKAPG